MSVKSFKFVSPGVFLNEIDNSILPNQPKEIGPLFVGRALRGPAMRPVTVDSFEQFVNLYGAPVPGGDGDDVWRNGNKSTPMYATYAAQAWLKNSPTLTFFRLAGTEHTNKGAGSDASAGWKTSYFLPSTNEDTASIGGSTSDSNAKLTNSGGAFGLFVFPQKINGVAAGEKSTTGSLAAVWYIDEGSIGLKGTSTFAAGTVNKNFAQAEPIASDSDGNFVLVLTGSNYKEQIKFNLDKNHKNFIRKVFNTNPTLVNSTITTTDNVKKYWLGETFENTIKNFDVISTTCVTAIPANGTNTYWGVITYLGQITTSSPKDHAKSKRSFTDPETGWFFSQDLGVDVATFDPRLSERTQKLFKFISLGHGEWAQNNVKMSIQNIKAPTNDFNPYPTFDVVIRNIGDSDKAQQVLEKFSNCNLNPKSPDYIGSKIGDQYYEFNDSTRRLILKGKFTNKSKFIRVEMNSEVDAGSLQANLVPFGVYGPTTYRDFRIDYDNGSHIVKAVTTSSASPTEVVIDTNVERERIWVTAGKLDNTRSLERFGQYATKVDALDSNPIADLNELDRKSTRLNSSHSQQSRMPSSA